MKIDMNINRVINIYSKNLNISKTNENKISLNDCIEISKEGRELQKYIDLAKNTEIKNGRVDEIKRLIDEGNYNFNAEELAKSIMEYIKECDK
ncbi:flagellar biosynthesis anti-sigma factor FlgM [Caloramator sp. E03]|uniref:flagellar biosynthesis anti-sigma factor FlgM n=1 Tax=Caloramator sp. E03 TaxID=2576307 RepID=UPI0011101B74|nr:flagellar biosynthesis anti-sigma factor FlgM [Caloramator sp. E03]QCX32377.1 flagellar biosynthesis anti-sigma factor FlgM [Caloramator sp. E03]